MGRSRARLTDNQSQNRVHEADQQENMAQSHAIKTGDSRDVMGEELPGPSLLLFSNVTNYQYGALDYCTHEMGH